MSEVSTTIPLQTTGSSFQPKPIASIDQTGLGILWLQDLTLKTLYYSGVMTGFSIAETLCLPFSGVTDQILLELKKEKFVEVRSSQQMGVGEGAFVYAITEAGMIRAKEAIERCQYVGPAPVTLKNYVQACMKQTRGHFAVTNRVMRQILSHLVLPEKTFQKVGPAVNSGLPIFLYGPSGNGKTSIARSIGKLVTEQEIFIPHAIFVEGQVILVYDSVNHQPVEDNEHKTNNGPSLAAMRRDTRWVKVKRPFVVVGGELTLDGLDLVFDDTNKYYEAPFQIKANGGILLIDDFGRQMVHPRDLLNRWIVPLENHIDYLTLHTGKKIEVPFDVMVMFSTNLPPSELVDEAFLRRLRHKIEIGNPTFDEFREIFKRSAIALGVGYSDDGLAYLLKEWYLKQKRNLRGSHPSELCSQILDIAHYLGIQPAMTVDLLERAAQSYCVNLS
ncbi:MAG: AAA family ATPase [Anaerolineaceae bacterium]|nr:AAA family ATPase [Anaerolineaceae bacterium]